MVREKGRKYSLEASQDRHCSSSVVSLQLWQVRPSKSTPFPIGAQKSSVFHIYPDYISSQITSQVTHISATTNDCRENTRKRNSVEILGSGRPSSRKCYSEDQCTPAANKLLQIVAENLRAGLVSVHAPVVKG